MFFSSLYSRDVSDFHLAAFLSTTDGLCLYQSVSGHISCSARSVVQCQISLWFSLVNLASICRAQFFLDRTWSRLLAMASGSYNFQAWLFLVMVCDTHVGLLFFGSVKHAEMNPNYLERFDKFMVSRGLDVSAVPNIPYPGKPIFKHNSHFYSHPILLWLWHICCWISGCLSSHFLAVSRVSFKRCCLGPCRSYLMYPAGFHLPVRDAYLPGILPLDFFPLLLALPVTPFFSSCIVWTASTEMVDFQRPVSRHRIPVAIELSPTATFLFFCHVLSCSYITCVYRVNHQILIEWCSFQC